MSTTEYHRDVAHRALGISHAPLLRHQRHGLLVEREGVRFAAFDLPGFSTVAVLGETPPPVRVFALADEVLAGRPGGYRVRVEADAGGAMEAALRAWGWRVTDELPALVLPAIPPPPPAPPELSIRLVVDAATLRDYYTASNLPDEPSAARPDHDEPVHPPDINEWMVPSVACATDPEIAIFVGYVAGAPVATAGLYRVDEIAEIGSVGVAAPLRRRGYGAAMTWAALAEGARRGCTVAALDATALGHPLYRAMGFLDVCVYRDYERGRG